MISVLVPTLVVSIRGSTRNHDATKKQICTTTKRFRGDVQYSSSRFAQQRVERRGVAVEPQVDAPAVAFEVLREISAVEPHRCVMRAGRGRVQVANVVCDRCV
jgi:hypothetical protein